MKTREWIRSQPVGFSVVTGIVTTLTMIGIDAALEGASSTWAVNVAVGVGAFVVTLVWARGMRDDSNA